MESLLVNHAIQLQMCHKFAKLNTHLYSSFLENHPTIGIVLKNLIKHNIYIVI